MLWGFLFQCVFPVPEVSGMGSGPLPSPCPLCPFLLQTVLQVHLSPDAVFALSTLFSVASFLHLAVESLLCQSLGCFLVICTDMGAIELSPRDKVSLGSYYSTIFPGSLDQFFHKMIFILSLSS